MTNTVEQTITKAEGWADVVAAVVSGLVQNTGRFSFRFKEVTTTPLDADTGGHILAPGDSVEYALTGVFKLSMRSLTGDGIIAITEA